MNWTSYKPLTCSGQNYGQKDVEFRRFLELPAMVGPARLEVAMNKTQHMKWETQEKDFPENVAAILRDHPQWTPWELLKHMKWRVVDAVRVCGNLDSYRNYIESSKAEWSVAKNGYVRGQAGWFSCRSACYLAAGRPVIVQDTGFSTVLPVGEGILAFNTMEEAVAGIRAVETDYTRHTKAARDIAEEYFDSRKVLGRLIEDAMTVD